MIHKNTLSTLERGLIGCKQPNHPVHVKINDVIIVFRRDATISYYIGTIPKWLDSVSMELNGGWASRWIWQGVPYLAILPTYQGKGDSLKLQYWFYEAHLNIQMNANKISDYLSDITLPSEEEQLYRIFNYAIDSFQVNSRTPVLKFNIETGEINIYQSGDKNSGTRTIGNYVYTPFLNISIDEIITSVGSAVNASIEKRTLIRLNTKINNSCDNA